MTFSLDQLAIAYSNQMWLEFSLEDREVAWSLDRDYSHDAARWRAYLNRLCLNILVPALQQQAQLKHLPQVWPHPAALPSIWEVVNGTAITLGQTRIVIIPSVTIDTEEFCVPSEWVDIPSFAADYYLAVQVNHYNGWLRVWGFTTHRKLKHQGKYDPSDRTYSLEPEDLFENLNVLWLAKELCLLSKAKIQPLPKLSPTQAERLMAKLGQPSPYSPRLLVGFAQWGALLEHGGWRQRLYQQRQGLKEQWSILEWFQTGVSDFAQQMGWALVSVQPSWSEAKGAELTLAPALRVLLRQLVIAGQHYSLRVTRIGSSEQRTWRFELRSFSSGGRIPGGMKLRLLTEDLQTFLHNEAVAVTAVDQLYIEVELEPGEGLVWETEPIPENYEREILRF